MSDSSPTRARVLLTGATGFVGSYLHRVLQEAGFDVVGMTREPSRAARRYPGRTFVGADASDAESTLAAMKGCTAAVYLVHGMSDHADYEYAEACAAEIFADAADRAGLSRIVYLGGIKPVGKPSRHLDSRMRTGQVLRAGRVPAIELRATMVIGPGSASWRIVRDLASRLPVVVLPRRLDSRSQPIDISDVAVAIVHALRIEPPLRGVYSLPGPDTLSAGEILGRTARLLGLRPRMLGVPMITPQLSSYWVALVTRADRKIARQLLEGLRSDLVAPDDGFWKLLPEHERVRFDEAARRALDAEERELPFSARAAEWALHRVTRAAKSEHGARHERPGAVS